MLRILSLQGVLTTWVFLRFFKRAVHLNDAFGDSWNSFRGVMIKIIGVLSR